MPKIAVMIDRWKLPHFEKEFAKAGYSYSIDPIHGFPVPILRLTFWGELEKASETISEAQRQAAMSLN